MNQLFKFVRLFEKRFRFLDYIPPSGKILACGCGDFSSSAKLIEARSDIAWHAIDIYAAESIPDSVKFCAVNLENEPIPFNDETFDGIFLLHVLEHIDNLPRVCSEISRVLKKSGYIYIEVPSILTLFAPTSKRFFSMSGNFFDDITHKRIFTISSMNYLITNYLNMEVISTNKVRNLIKIIALPATIIYSIYKWKAFFMSSIGDLLGYRIYSIAKKG